MKVGIIGMGGGGSLLNEWLARLGVGHIIAIDSDRVDLTNLPRLVGATRWDARSILTKRKTCLRTIGKRLSAYKVRVARRVAIQANPSIKYEAVIGSVVDSDTAQLLKDVDFLFLATDSIQSRLVFNALVHQYLIPGAQIGAKVDADPKTGQITNIFTATRLVMPNVGGGCLECHGLIPSARLQEEALPERERRAQRYVEDPDVEEPSVITLNVLSAAQAVNDLMMMFTGLFCDAAPLLHQMNFARERKLKLIAPTANDRCPDCSNHPKSRRARGDRARLPCRQA